jgi:hypothetical protein
MAYLEKIAAEDIALLVKVAGMDEDAFEKLASDLGMTKEALKGKILGNLFKFLGRGRKAVLPSAAEAQAGLQSMRLSAGAGAGALGKSQPLHAPAAWLRGGDHAPAAWLRGGGHGSQTIPILPKGGQGAIGKAERGFDKVISSYADKAPAAAAASGGAPWTLGRKLKWGAGLGGAGLLGYSMLGGGGGQQAPQQYYGQQAAYGY